MSDRQTGVVKTVNRDRETGAFMGYGFITPDGGDPNAKDIFVHKSGCNFELDQAVGQRVSFEIEQGEKGLRAVNVQLEAADEAAGEAEESMGGFVNEAEEEQEEYPMAA